MWDQCQLDELYANSLTYLHGHSVGGTNPSLLRAMGAGTAVLAWNVPFNREVAGDSARYFGDPGSLAALIDATEHDPDRALRDGEALREVVRTRYRWDDVAVAYEALAMELKAGVSTRARHRHRVAEHPVAAVGPRSRSQLPDPRSGLEGRLR